jgi:outer membrane protein insertion porin family
VLDERQVKEDSEKIREFYQKKGYNRISIYYEIERDRSTGFGTVVFHIREGDRVKVKSISFVGNDNVKARKLRKVMETKKYVFWSWLIGTGRFKDDEFEDDLDLLKDYYREEGYLDIAIPPEKIEYNYPSPGQLHLVLHVEEGRQYRIGKIDISGSEKIPGPLLRFALRQQSGMVFAPEKLDEDAREIEKFYGRGGHLDARVTLLRIPNLETGDIDLEYIIDEDIPYEPDGDLQAPARKYPLLRGRKRRAGIDQHSGSPQPQGCNPGRTHRQSYVWCRIQLLGARRYFCGVQPIQFRYLQPPFHVPRRRAEVPFADAAG